MNELYALLRKAPTLTGAYNLLYLASLRYAQIFAFGKNFRYTRNVRRHIFEKFVFKVFLVGFKK